MLHGMYDAIQCVPSMFMIYEYNGCACKLISCLAEENKSLITGDNEIFDCCRGKQILDRCWGFQKSLIVEDEKSWDHCWGLKILGDLWGLNKSFDNFCGE